MLFELNRKEPVRGSVVDGCRVPGPSAEQAAQFEYGGRNLDQYGKVLERASLNTTVFQSFDAIAHMPRSQNRPPVGIDGVSNSNDNDPRSRLQGSSRVNNLLFSNVQQSSNYGTVGESGEPSQSSSRNTQETLSGPSDRRARSIERKETLESVRLAMQARGFCPHHIEALSQRYSLPVLSKMSQIDKSPHRRADHRECLNSQRCVAFNINRNDYRQSHTDSCVLHRCYTVSVDQDQLIAILESGDVPLVSIIDRPGERLELKLHRRWYQKRYTTISHVWVDGLGKLDENTLPACRVRQLENLLDDAGPVTYFESIAHGIFPSLYESGYLDRLRSPNLFWLDVLCIPGKRQHHHLKQKCFTKVSSIFAGSERVIVLDRELVATKYNRFDALYQIACSTWMFRGWTLLEGAMAPRCLFRFSDKLVDPVSEYVRAWSIRRPVTRAMSAATEIEQSIARDFLGPANQESQLSKMIFMWNALAGRSMVQSEELPLVFAGCLDLDLKQIIRIADTEEQLRQIICSHSHLPLSILYNSGLKSRGRNKWMPAAISSDILREGSLIKMPYPHVSRHSAEAKWLELKLKDDVLVYCVEEAMLHTQRFIIVTEAFCFEARALEIGDEMAGSCESGEFCIIIERSPPGCTTSLRGAKLRVVGKSRGTGAGNGYHKLEYICPLRLVALDGSCAPPPNTTSSIVEYVAQGLDSRTSLFLQHDPMPYFKPLTRRTIHPARIKTVQVTLALLIYLVILSVCLYKMGVRRFNLFDVAGVMYFLGLPIVLAVLSIVAFLSTCFMVPTFAMLGFVVRSILSWQNYD